MRLLPKFGEFKCAYDYMVETKAKTYWQRRDDRHVFDNGTQH